MPENVQSGGNGNNRLQVYLYCISNLLQRILCPHRLHVTTAVRFNGIKATLKK
ncbi:hypothetical protein [Taibaiella soli]|uniref:hypothetical protein n=1 Tax=Taibaiella soli TaxID=1649169 RepID=UPI001A9E16CD|nr:hypothetical protein [Taibaiella soli]